MSECAEKGGEAGRLEEPWEGGHASLSLPEEERKGRREAVLSWGSFWRKIRLQGFLFGWLVGWFS